MLKLPYTEGLKTLTVGISGLSIGYYTPWGLMMAGSVLSFLPVFVVFMIARDKFISGLTAGAIKG